jgi:hypothetical protein
MLGMLVSSKAKMPPVRKACRYGRIPPAVVETMKPVNEGEVDTHALLDETWQDHGCRQRFEPNHVLVARERQVVKTDFLPLLFLERVQDDVAVSGHLPQRLAYVHRGNAIGEPDLKTHLNRRP